MKKRVLAFSAAILVILGSGTAYAGDTVLFTPILSAPVGGSLECWVTNVGKKMLPALRVAVYANGGGSTDVCYDVRSALNSLAGHTCSRTTTGDAACRITITGGSYKSVRAVLNVVDSSGATILSVPATK